MANILVVDDEPIIKSGIARIVKRVMPEASVFTCESAEEAFHQLQETPCEIVFCDIALPCLCVCVCFIHVLGTSSR